MIQDNIENILALLGIILICAGVFMIWGAGVCLLVGGSLFLFLSLFAAVLNAFKPTE